MLGNDPVGRLYKAIINYVEKKGGSIYLISGIEVQDWHEGTGKFRVAVRCLGRLPDKLGGPPE